MDTKAGGQPPTVSATPAAAPAAASSSTVQQDLGTKAKAAVTPGDVRALTEQLRQNQLKPPVAAVPPPQEAEPAPAEETPAAEVAPETPPEETPAVEGDTEPAETEPAPEAEDGDTEGDGPVTPLTGKRAHLRLKEDDEVGNLALAFKKRNKDWSLSQAMEAAQKQLGVTPQQEAKAPAAEDPKTAALPKTVAEVDARSTQRLADLKKALAEVNFEQAADIQAELFQLMSHRSTLERRVESDQQQAVAKYDQDFSKSEAQAIDLYPFAADPNSVGAKRMSQIEATMLKNGDPAYHSANKPLLLAQMVAAELKIAPRNKNASPAKAAAPAVPALKKGVLPTGGSRTTPVTNQKPALVEAVGQVRSVHDLRKVMRSVGIQT